ncbi:UxaA family hydrolase [Paraburkholderia solisilvae]|uniref:(2R)-sulfolactate sulfo-lyase subunit beta n=1 Tax=Paraburkholderia solisilvae TaxID=624376 RepID=A0A6J5E6W9_9BURK|nr:UxaA family hydrolase [Paraburkholderia solisilvae]CAB3761096.1 (2R)-sulfolactate sulfo-lyase subunit beta [Paraburkholderia solisilvae]
MTDTSVTPAVAQPQLQGYLRSDGRKGIRNVVAVAYLVECAHHVAREIVTHFRDPLDAFDDPAASGAAGEREPPVHLIGFPGCYPNSYAEKMMERLTTHPNIGAVLFVSLGCESMNKHYLVDAVRASGRPVDVLTIQEKGGTRSTIQHGIDWVEQARGKLATQRKVPMALSELVIGTVCGGSDGTSGITANPAVGRAFDELIDAGATCIFEETGELVGCEFHMKSRAARAELGDEIVACVAKAARYYSILGHGSFAVGNADGGLTTQEEKSLGAYAKSGASPIVGIVKPGDVPPTGGLYLLDVVPDGEPRFGFPNISDNAEIAELIACGSHLILFTTGRGSVVGSAISPVIKVCANPDTYRNLSGDMDVDAGRILEGRASLDEVGREVFDVTVRVAQGIPSKSETLGHQEFILTYKTFEPVGPACLPGNAVLTRRMVEIAP